MTVSTATLTAGEAAELITERTREGPAEALLTSDEFAARVGLKTRQTRQTGAWRAEG